VLLPGECLDSDRQAVAGRVEVSLTRFAGPQPGQVRTAAGSLFGGDAEFPHQVLLRVRWRREHRNAEPLHQAPRIALMPGGRQHDRCLAFGRELHELARRVKRVEEQQTVAVVDRVGGNLLLPRLTRLPVRMRRLPVPDTCLQLAHSAMLGESGQVGAGHLAAAKLAGDDFTMDAAEPETLISRSEVVGTLFTLTDIAVDVNVIRAILEENDEEEDQQGEA
jgi:hypothetical protein